MLRVNKTINEVRSPNFAHIDDPRAIRALEKLLECANSETDSVCFDSASASDLIALIQSQKYARYIIAEASLDE